MFVVGEAVEAAIAAAELTPNISLGRRHKDTVHAAKKNVAENAQNISTSKPVP